MQEVGIKFLANDSTLVSSFDRAIEKAIAFVEAEDMINEKNKEIAASSKASATAVDGMNTKLNDTIATTKKAVKDQEAYNDALKGTIGEIKVFGVSLNDAKSKLKTYQSNLSGLTKGFGNASKGSKVLSLAMKGIPLVALVAAFAALVTFLSTTERGANALSKIMAVFAAVTEKVIDTVNIFGEAVFDAVRNPKQAFEDLVDFIKTIPSLILDNVIGRLEAMGRIATAVFNLDFKAAAAASVDAMTGVEDTVKKVTESVSELSDEIGETVEKALDLERAKIALKKAEIELTTSFRATRAEIKELNKEGEDVTKSYGRRKDAISEAFELENKLLGDRLGIAQRNLDLTKRDIALNSDGDKIESLEAIAEAEQRISEIKEESNELQTTLQNKLNAITKEQQAEVQKLNDAYAALNATLFESLQELDLAEADPIQRLAMQRELSIAALEGQKDALIGAASAIGKPIDNIEENYNRLIAAAEKQFDREDFLIRVNLTPELDGNLDTTKIDFKEIPKLTVPARELVIDVGEVTVEEETFLTAFKDLFENIKDTFESDEFKDLVSAIGTVFNEFAGIFTEGIDNQIADIDRLTDKRQEDIDKLTDELDEEKSLREKGFAFNIDGKQKEIDELNALQEADNKRKEELAAEAQRIQLIQDSLQQGSSLLTASSNILKGFSTIPIVGLPLGIAAVGALLAAFAKLKIDAFKATRLYTGSDRLYDDIGQIAPGESSDVPGRGDGFRIVDNNGMTRARVGGEETLIDGDTSVRYAEVFKWIKNNKSKYTNVDMMKLLSGDVMPAISSRTTELSQGYHVSDNKGYNEEMLYRVMKRVSSEGNDDLLDKEDTRLGRRGKKMRGVNGQDFVVVRG